MLKASDPLKDVLLLKVLGEGAFATVYSGVIRSSGRLCALKVLRTAGESDGGELALLQRLPPHANIVSLLGAWAWEGRLTCALTLADLSLLELASVAPLSEAVVREVAGGVLRALAHLHAAGVLHRDVKAANVLVARDAGIMLSDFGVSAELTRERAVRTTLAGSPLWLAPEVVKGKRYSTPSDVWSFGILLCEILDQGAAPLSDTSVIKAVFRIASEAPPPEPRRRGVSQHLLALIASALRRNPTERPSAAALLEHPFFAGAPPGGDGAAALDDAIEAALPLLAPRRAPEGAPGAAAAAAATAPTSPPSEDAAPWSAECISSGGGGGGSLVQLRDPPPPLPLASPPPLPLASPPQRRSSGTLRRSSSTLLPASGAAKTSAASSSGSATARPATTTTSRVAEPLRRLPWVSPKARAPPPAVAAAAAMGALGGSENDASLRKRAELLLQYQRVCEEKKALERALAEL